MKVRLTTLSILASIIAIVLMLPDAGLVDHAPVSRVDDYRKLARSSTHSHPRSPVGATPAPLPGNTLSGTPMMMLYR